MAGPGDEIVAGAGGRGRLRASHADREQVIEAVKAAFVHGRLDRDEFDLRVGRALASRTYADAGRPYRRHPRPADRSRAGGARPGIGEQEGSRGDGLGDRRIHRHLAGNDADAGRVAFCDTSRRGLVRLGYGRADRPGLCSCTTGSTSALAGSLRRGCHRAQVVRRHSQPPGTGAARPGRSGRPVTVGSTPPKRHEAALRACPCPGCGHRVEGIPSSAVRYRLVPGH